MTDRIQEIEKQLKKELDKSRYKHTQGVMYTAACLAMRYGGNLEQAYLAGLLHDCAKCIPGEKQIHICEKNHILIRDVERENPFLLHAKTGAFLARTKYGIDDPSVLHAIETHTTGAAGMNLLDKIIFVSDYIEPRRDKAPNLSEVRTLAFENLDEAVLRILHDTIHYLNQKRGAIDHRTKDTYEYYKELLRNKP